MSTPLILSSQTFPTIRLTLVTKLPFDQVLANLYREIGDPSEAKIGQILAGIKSFDKESLQTFEGAVNDAVGEHGFMIFNEYNHGRWTPLYQVGEYQKTRRIVLGNPLKAITMLKQDSRAGLAVPVEILVLENSRDGGTQIVWNLPSSLVVGGELENEALTKAAKFLDVSLEKLLKFVAEDGFAEGQINGETKSLRTNL
ncbi:hypothetical protein PVAG01_05972 [Phlyctema vagabunda]|uniref:DUF302 domain-containing protein n=1 Tax=Phlyctema vagabunda TaxID=108571 RepID=A0ABR4PEQ6_9HELO